MAVCFLSASRRISLFSSHSHHRSQWSNSAGNGGLGECTSWNSVSCNNSRSQPLLSVSPELYPHLSSQHPPNPANSWVMCLSLDLDGHILGWFYISAKWVDNFFLLLASYSHHSLVMKSRKALLKCAQHPWGKAIHSCNCADSVVYQISYLTLGSLSEKNKEWMYSNEWKAKIGRNI